MGFLIQSARQDLYGFSLRVNHLWFKLEKNPLCVLLFYIIGGSRHLLINLYRNLSGSYTTWRNCINTSYILAIQVVRFWSKDTALKWHNREAVSFFLNKCSATTHLWYKIILHLRIMFIYKWQKMFTVNNKSPSVWRPVRIWHTLVSSVSFTQYK